MVGDMYHEKCWVDFFKNHEECYSVYVHSKEGLSDDSPFKKSEISTVPTRWGYLMEAEITLLQAALEDSSNTKFVFVSDSTIPIQSFDFSYRHLLSHPYSEFVIRPNVHKRRTFSPLDGAQVFKNSQWIILNRKHAELMVKDTKIIEIMKKYPFQDEHYPSTILSLYNLQHEIVNHDCTFVLWPRGRKDKAHPHTFSDLMDDEYTPFLLDEVLTQNTLFARKFSKDCDIEPLLKYRASQHEVGQ